CGANNLNAFGLLGPTDGVTNRCGLIGTRGGGKSISHFVKQRRRDAANFLDHLGRIARKVAPQYLENTARMSQGDRKSTRLNSSHLGISYAVFCLKKKNE